MSSQIFPSLPGLGWSVSKAPAFSTRIQRSVSGRELRVLDYPNPIWTFSLVYDFLRENPAAGYDELNTLMGFFLQRQGAYDTFLFTDPTDCSVSGQYFGTGDGITTVFQLYRALGTSLYGGGFFEPTTAPNAVGAVYFNGIAQSPSGYSVDPSTGLVTFTSPPGVGAVITADFTYYFRCRFIDDASEFENFMHQLWTLKKLQFVSVLL